MAIDGFYTACCLSRILAHYHGWQLMAVAAQPHWHAIVKQHKLQSTQTAEHPSGLQPEHLQLAMAVCLTEASPVCYSHQRSMAGPTRMLGDLCCCRLRCSVGDGQSVVELPMMSVQCVCSCQGLRQHRPVQTVLVSHSLLQFLHTACSSLHTTSLSSFLQASIDIDFCCFKFSQS